MEQYEELLGIFDTELKRGTLTLAILSQLHSSQYGYSLLQSITDKQIEIEAGTLYPMLRRLEKQGILVSDWDTTESRPRKYYVLSDLGRTLYQQLAANWRNQVEIMKEIIGEAGT
ncbi:MAG: transcriptional regulator PadR family protein [Paenibacillaceae bacterium]|nr:transcriptional regulator PadR family protein [Paenibacillaceae bacterium]